MLDRRKMSKEDRREIEDIQKSLRVASSIEQFYNAVTVGSTKEHNDIESESSNLSIDFDNLAKSLSSKDTSYETSKDADIENNKNAINSGNLSRSSKTISLSKNQANAISKFPSLIEFLGKPEGEAIAKKVLSDILVKLSVKIGENSQKINKHATVCVSDKHNIKQGFKTDDYICVITASGPFRGNEAICYDPVADEAKIVRISESSSSDEIDLIDVSSQFNFIHEVEELKSNGEENLQ